MITYIVAVNKEGKSPEPWGTPILRGQGAEKKSATENEGKSEK